MAREYQPDKVKQAAEDLILAVLALPHAKGKEYGHEHVFREMLDTLVWKFTERGPANHKYKNCEQWSVAA